MTVELSDEQEAAVMEIAQRDSKNAGDVLVEAARWLSDLADDEAERRILEERIAEADSPDAVWLSHEEVGRLIGLLPKKA